MAGHKAAITDCNMSPGADMIASVDVEGNIIITKIADGSQSKMKTEGQLIIFLYILNIFEKYCNKL